MDPHAAYEPHCSIVTGPPRAARIAVALVQALEAAPIGFVLFDRELRLVHLNAWFARAVDLPRDAEGHTLREILQAPSLAPAVAQVEARLRSVLATGRPAAFSTPSPDAEHPRGWVSTLVPVRGRGGAVHFVCGIVADVTADREREAAIARARAEAERTARRLGFLQDVAAALAEAKDPADVAGAMVDRVAPLVGAAAATLRVVRGGALELLARSAHLDVSARVRSLPLGAPNPIAAAVSRAEAVWLEDRAAVEERLPDIEGFGPAGAIAILPLAAGRASGAITFAFDRPRAFEPEERAFLLAAGEQCAQALDRALAHEAERKSRRSALRATMRLSRLQAITAALSAASTVEEVARVLVHEACTTLGAHTAVAYVMERGGSRLSLAAAMGTADSHRDRLATLSLDSPAPAALAARTGEALWLPTRAELRAAFPRLGAVAPYADEIGALAALPLWTRGEVLGSVSFAFRAEQRFEPEDRELLSSAADQCAQALDRARLLDAERDARAGERRASERLERLQRITAALSAARTPTEVAATIAERVHPLVHAAVSAAYALEPDGASLRLIGVRGGNADRSVLDRLPAGGPLPPCRAAASGEPSWLETPEAIRDALGPLATGHHRRSALATLPLRAGGRVLGAISFGFDAPHRLDEPERRFLVSVAEQCAVALDRSRLLEDEHRAREEAERARSLLNAILENAPLGIGLFDAELRFQRVNRRLAEMNGVSAEAHIGRTPRELLPGVPMDDAERSWRRVMETGEPAEDVEISGVTPAAPGRRVWIASWYPVRSGGATIGVGALVRDVTREREAREFERHVVGVVGHDLRNPLSAIVIGTKLLRRPELAAADRARLLDRVATSAARIEEIARALLDFANVRGGGGVPVRLERHDLAEIARDVAAECALAHPGRQVVCTGEGDCTGEWDPGRIAQLLTNLVSNALQHGAEDVPVRVRWDGRGREVVVEVANAGRPIPPEILPRLFEPFQRGEDAGRGGVGLGLFIARAIAAAHRGRIDVRSAEPEGTVFSVRLARC